MTDLEVCEPTPARVEELVRANAELQHKVAELERGQKRLLELMKEVSRHHSPRIRSAGSDGQEDRTSAATRSCDGAPPNAAETDRNSNIATAAVDEADANMEDAQYEAVMAKLRGLMPDHVDAPTENLLAMWRGLGGFLEWEHHISPRELTLALSRVDATDYTLCDEAPCGFVELILSQLPRLEKLVLRLPRYLLDAATMDSVLHAFPSLQHVDLANSAWLTDGDVVELARRAVNLNTLILDGCPHVSWEGIEMAMAQVPSGIPQLSPASREVKAEQDHWLELGGEESQREYQRLRGIYRDYLGLGNADAGEALWRLWMHLDGVSGWQLKLSSAQLSLLLSRERVTKLNYRVLRLHGSQSPCGTIAATELRGFVSQFLARLPKLSMLYFYDLPEWPFDWGMMELLEMEQPFPALVGTSLYYSPCSCSDILDLVRKVKTLGKVHSTNSDGIEGITVHERFIRCDSEADAEQLKVLCEGHLYTWK